jgi:iron-sulfur cluster repair protein YtfE (RIC family)
MVTKPKTEAEAEAMRAALNDFDAKRRQKEEEARAARLAPLREFVGSAAFAEVRDRAEELAPLFTDMAGIHVHLGPLPMFLQRLEDAAR